MICKTKSNKYVHSHHGLQSVRGLVQSLLTLLGSCVCSPSHRHVVSVHHGDGSVERHPFATPAPATTLLRWKLFPHGTKPILKMKFHKLQIGQFVQYVVYFVQHGKWLYIFSSNLALKGIIY